ncbi:hypothetical protein G7Y89_g8053 [Cudoniella acicularis]|uniref:Amine oxidase domain-containing protein n=1 Tax=Cudoniella acicularis TaxID=354080 RepID=A0A8H4W0Y8_9HELO|nr:hypothetical protein G7Y89_g8053 [Cudoniella acicularis]
MISSSLSFASGVGNILTTPAFYIFQNFGVPQLNALLNNGYATTTNHDNSELYDSAVDLLGSAVLYNSTALSIKRSTSNSSPNQILVSTPTGPQLILANKLLIAIPPTLANLPPLDMTPNEASLFSQWQWSTYYAGVVRGGLPDGTSGRIYKKRRYRVREPSIIIFKDKDPLVDPLIVRPLGFLSRLCLAPLYTLGPLTARYTAYSTLYFESIDGLFTPYYKRGDVILPLIYEPP